MSRIVFERELGSRGDETSFRMPRATLYGAGALMLLAGSLAFLARRTGVGASLEPVSVPVEQRSLQLLPGDHGTMAVVDLQRGDTLVLRSDGNGFLFGLMRSIAYKRKVASVDSTTPFALTRWQNGQVTLDDPATGMHVAVNSFGPTQMASVAQLFHVENAPSR